MNNKLEKLPSELRARVISLLPQQDVLTCFRLKAFHHFAKECYYYEIEVNGSTNEQLLKDGLTTHSIGLFTRELNIIHNLKNTFPNFFWDAERKDELLLCFPNLKRISFRQMNPFYILASLSRYSFKYLEEIDIEWESCNSSTGTQKNFYAALLHHSKTITKIEMPFSESQSALFNFDNNSDLKKFIASFKKSPKIVYQPEGVAEERQD
ncbi:unnamed protein product [Mucor hiemalis]